MFLAITSCGQRQFKLDLGIKGKEGFARRSSSEDGNIWTIQRDLFQGLEIDKLRGLFVGSEKKSVYKLALNTVTLKDTRGNLEDRKIQGAFGLVKITWGGNEGGGKNGWKVEEVTINDENKVWLIMAKGQANIYLIPVVRASAWCGLFDAEGWQGKLEKSKKEVEESGVNEIATWTEKFDRLKRSQKEQETRLKEMMKFGFSITRKTEDAVSSWKSGEYEIVERRSVKEGKKEEWEKEKERNIRYLHKNAGVLEFTSETEKTQRCNKVEHYFPLDFVVLGDIDVKGNLKDAGRITVYDTITDVIGVRLDQVFVKNHYHNCFSNLELSKI